MRLARGCQLPSIVSFASGGTAKAKLVGIAHRALVTVCEWARQIEYSVKGLFSEAVKRQKVLLTESGAARQQTASSVRLEGAVPACSPSSMISASRCW
ncbi:hypothetical protein HDG38_003561 [Paraburkholderia sp. WSM4177]|nr:hypothetical protein [Paraburkholderia sp. WSM4177]